MKKFNKILTMTVAMLLTLVLLTSSIVSTTLAKYVVSKDATTTVSLNRFNLDVTFTYNESYKDSAKNIGDSVEVTLKNIALKPGDDYKNLITASISGTPTVDANIKIEIIVTEDDSSKFNVLATNFTGLSDSRYLPMGVYVGGTSVIAPYTPYAKDADIGDEIQTAIATKIETLAKTPTNITNETRNGGTVTAKVAATKAVSLTGLGIGFDWPKTHGADADAQKLNDNIGTWVSKNQPTFNITYRITVEQA